MGPEKSLTIQLFFQLHGWEDTADKLPSFHERARIVSFNQKNLVHDLIIFHGQPECLRGISHIG